MTGTPEAPPPGTALLSTRAPASPLTPMVTAPMTVERAPVASGGPAAMAVGVNDTLRKAGLVRGLRLLRRANQDGGFDCPGCAWPNSDRPDTFAVCESGVRAIVDGLGQRRAGPQLFSTYTIPELARRSDHWLNAQGRLTHPLIRRPDANGYVEIGWDEAIETIAAALRPDRLSDPARALFYSSARISNEAAFCWQLLARETGTNNLPSSSHLCHEASRVALTEVLGTRRSPVTLADFEAAEAIFVFGQNPGSNHPRMLEALRAAKLRGAKIVAVNPLREVGLLRYSDPKRVREWLGDGIELADLLLPVQVGGDLALIEGLTKAVLEADAVDRAFVDAHTEGFAALAAQIQARSWADIVAQSGVEEDQLRAAAEIYARSKATIACWGVGLTQHRAGVDTIEQLLSLLLLRGNVGKPGAGPLAVLGHSNSAGCWTMAVDPRPSEAVLAGLAQATGVQMPSAPGHDVSAALAAMRAGQVDVLLGLGGNLLSAGPDTEAIAEGLRRCRLSVHIATKLNRSHLITGETGLLLPCLTRPERHLGADDRPQWSSFEDACGGVRASQGTEPPIGAGVLAEPDIIARIAAAARPDSPIAWPSLARDHGRIRALIAAALPDCERVFAELGPGRAQTVDSPARARRFNTATGRARLTTSATASAPSLPEGALLLTTVRAHDQHNTSVYWLGDRERGVHGYRRLVLMNLDDMQRLEIEPYEQVDLISHYEGVERRAPKWVAIPHHVRPGCLAAYFPEANVLVPGDCVDPRSGTPSFKSVVVTIERTGSIAREREVKEEGQ
ncbi:Formate dehydrogenase H [Enhygromyxa salina]|uniref:Formate dehydrogenase H n=1 Tax=Enhygromyxa salina TaxID=215803 RepID=A0A2S9YL04_9BACT|nr:FdhF/YdeP family oxidoreductase [Enhygromyxa salina]PRQ05795.1 Formate dehydrogenase H [Enhygromyxa salina]